MNIEFTRGVDDLLLGMNEHEVMALKGSPDKVVISDDSENRNLCYYGPRLVLKIEPANGHRLGWISVRNRNSRLRGLDPWSMERQALLQHLTSELVESCEFDDYGEMEPFFFPDSWVELQYDLGELTAINSGVPYDLDDEPRWPQRLA